jgi:hypothetical protein
LKPAENCKILLVSHHMQKGIKINQQCITVKDLAT